MQTPQEHSLPCDIKRRSELQRKLLSDLGCRLDHETRILDLGCGNGDTVWQYRQDGYQTFGCDFSFKSGQHTGHLETSGIIRHIDPEDYRLPFDDESFDVVLTDQVLEHVQDYSATLAEMRRVMKRGAVSLHLFPGRYRPVEVHVGVPFASLIQSHTWLYLWALLGIRRPAQRGLSAAVVAQQNVDYLTGNTNYLTRRQLQQHFADAQFEETVFCEHLFLKHTARGRALHAISQILPLVPMLFSACRTRVLYASTDIPLPA